MIQPDIENKRKKIFSPAYHLRMNSQDRPFLTIKEVSHLLGISVSTINRLIKKSEFPKKRKLSPGRVVFIKHEINEWISRKKISNMLKNSTF